MNCWCLPVALFDWTLLMYITILSKYIIRSQKKNNISVLSLPSQVRDLCDCRKKKKKRDWLDLKMKAKVSFLHLSKQIAFIFMLHLEVDCRDLSGNGCGRTIPSTETPDIYPIPHVMKHVFPSWVYMHTPLRQCSGVIQHTSVDFV